MEDQKQLEIKKITKSYNSADDMSEAFKLMMGITGACAIITSGIGGMAETTAAISLNSQVKEISSSEVCVDNIAERKQELLSDLASGKIAYSEFKQEYSSLMEGSNKESKSNDIDSFVECYNKTKDVSQTVLGKGFPVMAGGCLVSLMGYMGAEKARKSYERRLACASAEITEEEMAD